VKWKEEKNRREGDNGSSAKGYLERGVAGEGQELAPEVREEPEEQAQAKAENEAGDDGEVKGSVFAAMNDVAGKAAEAKRKLAAEVEECAEKSQESAKQKQGSAKFAERIHCDESKSRMVKESKSRRG
jgi:hypothetical protein